MAEKLEHKTSNIVTDSINILNNGPHPKKKKIPVIQMFTDSGILPTLMLHILMISLLPDHLQRS